MHGAGFTGIGRSHSRLDLWNWKPISQKVASHPGCQHRNRAGDEHQFSQIAADALGSGWTASSRAAHDTGSVPNSGHDVASAHLDWVVGKLVEAAPLGLKRTLLDSGLICEGLAPRMSRACLAGVTSKSAALANRGANPRQPPGLHWDDALFAADGLRT